MNATKLIAFFLGLASLWGLLFFGFLAFAGPALLNNAATELSPGPLAGINSGWLGLVLFAFCLPFVAVPGVTALGLWVFVVQRKEAKADLEVRAKPEREASFQARLDDLTSHLLELGGEGATLASEISLWTRGLDDLQQNRLLRLLAESGGSKRWGELVPVTAGESEAGSLEWWTRAVRRGLLAFAVFCFLWGGLVAFSYLTSDIGHGMGVSSVSRLGSAAYGFGSFFVTGLAALLARPAFRWLGRREASRNRELADSLQRTREVTLESCLRRLDSLLAGEHNGAPSEETAPVRIARAHVVCALAELDGPGRGRLIGWLRTKGVLSRLALSQPGSAPRSPSVSARARHLIPELTRSLRRAFRDHLFGPFRPAEKVTRETRQTDVSCPRQVWKGTARFSVVVRLTVGPAPHSVAKGFLDVEPGEVVQVNLQAPAFELFSAPWQAIAMPPGQDSPPAVFDLGPREAGPQSLILDFYQVGNHLGTVRVPVDVMAQPTPAEHAPVRAAVLSLDSEVPPPDRVLRITWHPESSTLVFTVIQDGGTSWWSPPSWQIKRDPAAWAEDLFQELNNLTERSDRPDSDVLGELGSLPARDIEEALRNLGQDFWRTLPTELRSLYARERDRWRNGSLLILSDEPHLPWELLWPYGEGWEDDEPWCLTLRLSRWLARSAQGDGNSGAPGILPLTAVACVAPSDNQLPATQKERLFLQQLLGQRGVRDVSPPVPTLGAVMDLLRASSYDWFHASSHGSFSADAPDQRSCLLLEGRQILTPRHFVGAKIEDSLRRSRPAFVFNICHSGRLGWELTGLGGWAERLISCGACLFLGSLWTVDDEAAAQMARSFYELLLDGETTVAEAARRARNKARKAGNPTWLAYSLYAHPNAKVRLPDQQV